MKLPVFCYNAGSQSCHDMPTDLICMLIDCSIALSQPFRLRAFGLLSMEPIDESLDDESLENDRPARRSERRRQRQRRHRSLRLQRYGLLKLKFDYSKYLAD